MGPIVKKYPMVYAGVQQTYPHIEPGMPFPMGVVIENRLCLKIGEKGSRIQGVKGQGILVH